MIVEHDCVGMRYTPTILYMSSGRATLNLQVVQVGCNYKYVIKKGKDTIMSERAYV